MSVRRLHPDVPFPDASGVRWSVAEVGTPSAGWLLFTSAHSLPRRYAPIPWGWQHLPLHGLRRLLDRSVAAPPTGAPAEGEDGTPTPLPVAAVEAAFLRERGQRLLVEDLLTEARVQLQALQSEIDRTRAASEGPGVGSTAWSDSGANAAAGTGPGAVPGPAPLQPDEKRAHFALGLAGTGRYRWYFSDARGTVAHRSDTYTSKGGARSGIEAFRREAADPAVRTAPVIETTGPIL